MLPPFLQVGALTLRFVDGRAEILLVTSRETRRWVIPKGWPMKGLRNWAAAAREAKEEAGVVGDTRKKPIGEYLYFKRRESHFDLCRVEVYPLIFRKQLRQFREKGQREARWFEIEEAAEAVQEPGLAALLSGLDLTGLRNAKNPKAKKASVRRNWP